MKWFKHMTDASDDAFLEEVEELFGLDGYARWWKLLETIGRSMGKEGEASAQHSWPKWQSLLKGKRKKLEAFFYHCAKRGKIQIICDSFSEEKGFISETKSKQTENQPEMKKNILKIICPKMLELRDEYTRKSGHSPDNVAQEAEADKDKDIYSPPLPPSFDVDKFIEGGGDDFLKKWDLLNVCFANLLGKNKLLKPEQELTSVWVANSPDRLERIWETVREGVKAYQKKNYGQLPKSLCYFKGRVEELR